MRLEHDDGGLSLESTDEGQAVIDVLIHDADGRAALDVDDLRWLVTTGGPAMIAYLERNAPPGAAAPGGADGEATDAPDEQPDLFAEANARVAAGEATS